MHLHSFKYYNLRIYKEDTKTRYYVKEMILSYNAFIKT